MIPSGAISVLLAVLVAGMLSFASGIFLLCKGKMILGVFLMAAPVILFGALFLYGMLNSGPMDM